MLHDDVNATVYVPPIKMLPLLMEVNTATLDDRPILIDTYKMLHGKTFNPD